MNNKEILENCWLMKTNHVLDEENKKVRQAIENLIQENKELEEKLQQYKKIEEIVNTITDDDIRNAIKNAEKDYIPKSKVKEKIETLEKLQNEIKYNDELRIQIIAYEELRIKIIAYKELLVEGE